MSTLASESLVSLPPLVSTDTRLLILGSFPGVASLKVQQYYGHPQNHFWKILQALWPLDVMGAGYLERSQWLLSKQLGVWDVYASCEREGSLDTSIRNAVLNDFTRLENLCPKLEAIAHNGGESFRHAKHTMRTGLPVYKLPSTSPANASWSFEKKLAAWHEVFKKNGLI